MMPDLDGYAVLQRIKGDPGAARHPGAHDLRAGRDWTAWCDASSSAPRITSASPSTPCCLQARVGACLEKKRLHDEEAAPPPRAGGDEPDAGAARGRAGRAARAAAAGSSASSPAARRAHRGRRRRRSAQDPPPRGHGGVPGPAGFTAFAETPSPRRSWSVLREYHAEMGRLILAHEGTLERFTGDGMMVFFNDPVVVPDPAAARDPHGGGHAGRRRRPQRGLAQARLGPRTRRGHRPGLRHHRRHRLRGALGLRRHRHRHQPGRAALRRVPAPGRSSSRPRSRGSWRI